MQASYQTDMIAPVVGKPIAMTIDAVTACGNVNLVNTSFAQLEADYTFLHEIVGRGIFTVED